MYLWRNFLGSSLAGLIVVGFCLLLLWHNPLVFWNDDYELSILPVFADVARSWNEGHLPLLSPYSWVCSNLGGEFQYGTFSVFVNAAVVFIWKFPLTFPEQAAALSIAHLFALAIGAFLLARDRQFSLALSIFVALVATLNGWIICWGATDWFGALGAFAWLPWAWWAIERALDRQRSRWRFLWPAPFVYLLVTGGFPYTVLMLLLLIAWLSIKSLVQTRNVISILPMLFGVALGFGVSAPAWLALLEYVRGSARQLQPSAHHWQWLVPPAALPGFILPGWAVNWANFSSRHLAHAATELTCGLVAPAALIAGFLWHPQFLIKRIKWELFLLLIVLVLSMIPTAGVFRWSFRWLPLLHLILAICAAEVWHVRPIAPIAFTSVLLMIAVATLMWICNTAGDRGSGLMLVYFLIAIVWTVGEWFNRSQKFREYSSVVVSFAVLLATYLCLPTNSGVPRFNFDQKLLEPAPLDPARLYLSIYQPPETEYRLEKKPGPVGQTVRPGSTSMWAGARLINGYSPIRAAGVAREFGFAIHGEIDPKVADYLLKQQAGANGKLALLGVDGIIVAREVDIDPQPASEWQLALATDEGRVFHRRGAPFARVRSVAATDSQIGQHFVPAMISDVKETRNRVEADIDIPPGGRPALIIFSRPYFRGYQAQIDGKNLVVESADGLVPIVRIPAGMNGRIKLAYRPGWLIYGGGLSILCAAIYLIGLALASLQATPSLSGLRHS